jgi:hypothetical protein
MDKYIVRQKSHWMDGWKEQANGKYTKVQMTDKQKERLKDRRINREKGLSVDSCTD